MFFFDDKPLSRELQNLLDAASMLDVGEFRLFELAYRSWYGKSADPRRLEQIFTQYMFCDQIPFWVRHYARQVLALARVNQLDNKFMERDELPVSRTDWRRGCLLYTSPSPRD